MKDVEVKLFFASMLGYKKYVDKNFGQEISWNNLRLDEFDHEFLNGEQVLPSTKELDAPSITEELDNYNPDAIITYGHFQKVQRRAHKWAKANNVPIVYITDSENRQRRKWYKLLAKFFLLRQYYNKVNYFFTVGDANEAYFKLYGVPEKKFIRMHYPIDVDVYADAYQNKAALRSQIREQYGIPKEDFVIAVVGKLVTWKNQEHLIDLLIDLESKGQKAHAFILGSGKTLDGLKQKAEQLKVNKAHFTGFVDPLSLPAYYAAIDAYVHPASIEPHSLAISEAIYMGCPVILSSTCGSYGDTDDVQVNKNGYVYNFGDIQELSEKVIKLINDQQLRQQFSDHSRKISLKFQQRAHRDSMLDLINKVNKSKRKAVSV
ncbi:glycosyltransferase family 4 protein [Mucilaginibacter kameinonensis]|uniref:glycosyltransferase family 4 protein n=1 Tax=Mucilaginibacter kameinonensis TaxID=452286 RepID=UPI0013CEED2C|nr:glycosyltransferase family 4 protein [Mucilaginibacter kameinonensis]